MHEGITLPATRPECGIYKNCLTPPQHGLKRLAMPSAEHSMHTSVYLNLSDARK